ncbi:MAG: rhamnulokinase [Treponema sp.]|jgi:rhamnulokinase|nr:rhamnulokinase [Treponema sp.]
MKYFLAVDIGASSGRHILGHLDNGKMICEEVHRFPNSMAQKGRELCWDLELLFSEVLHGMKRCAMLGKIPASVGIDTWGVDFALLDKDGGIIGNAVAYRDSRTNGMDAKVYERISEAALYSRTGIQKLVFNTIFQLMALKQDSRQYLEQAGRLLMLPDYLHYRLSGIAKTEYTIATTTGLVNAQTKTWDDKILDACAFPKKIFADIAAPGTILGCLKKEVQEQIGYNCEVVLPASHDTASAVMALPSLEENPLYISSGTWSLMGVERLSPDCSERNRKHNFTNEGGYDYRYRYLKNIMGLWMIQSVRKEYGDEHTYAELCGLAEKESILSIVDCNHSRFFSPKSMIHEIQAACMESGQQVPDKPGELAAVVYNSLAASYRDTVLELEQLTDRSYNNIIIVGGGSNAEYLNRLITRFTGKTVYAGPAEAASAGNLMAQMIAAGGLSGLTDGRECIRNSFEIKETHRVSEQV